MDLDTKTPRTGAARGRFETLIKAIQTADGVVIEGYASTPHPDRGDDIVLPSAFQKTLALYMTNPMLLWDHGMDPLQGNKPIGKVLEAEITNDGLRIRASVTNAEIAGMVQRGELRTMSFGYEVPPEGIEWMDDGNGGTLRVIKELELYEISIVAIPMNPQARFSLGKSLKAYFKNQRLDGSSTHTDASHDPASSDAPSLSPTPMPEKDTKSEEVVATEEVAAAPETPTEAVVVPSAPVPAPVETPAADAPAADADAPAPVEDPAPADTPAPTDADEQKAVEDTPAPTPAVTPKALDMTASPEPTPAPDQKSVPLMETPEVKALVDQTRTLDTELKASTARIATLEAELTKADTALGLLTDQFLAMKKAMERTATNKPFAVVGPHTAPKASKSASLLDRLTISPE